MNTLQTLEETLLEAKTNKEKPEELYKIGKVATYFKKEWSKENGDEYKDLPKGSFNKADGFLAGENNFIINKTVVNFDGKKVYKAVDDEFDKFYIYVDNDGNLFTDNEEKKGLYKKILK